MKARTHYLKSLKAAKVKRFTHMEKAAWVIARLESKLEYSKRVHIGLPMRPFVSATDEKDQEAWESAFGGKVNVYTMGPNISPAFARTLRRMWEEGDLARIIRGNQDAKQYCQKTYYIDYTFKTWPLKD